MGAIFIGISGWRYEPWRGVFYPPGLVQARELDYASRELPTIEINGSFYSLQRPSSYAAWYAATPSGFIFAGKWPDWEDVTADFMYIRLHGEHELYASGYEDDALERWASRIRSWRAGKQPADARLVSSVAPPKATSRDVYCYFDNDVKVRAPFDAKRLMALLSA
jgi:uncharacterized protein YecE (DUF72 family)